jgi:hypothetical protein
MLVLYKKAVEVLRRPLGYYFRICARRADSAKWWLRRQRRRAARQMATRWGRRPAELAEAADAFLRVVEADEAAAGGANRRRRALTE